MKIVLIGSNGQLGVDLARELSGEDLVALTHKDIEVADSASVADVVGRVRPDVIINTAAYVRVDDAEDHVKDCFRVNTIGARNVAVAAEEVGARMFYISSDYVYGADRTRKTPYTEFDPASPLNVLGKSKEAGENLIRELCMRYFIIRVSGLFGIAGASGKGGNFIETMLRLGRERDEVRVVNDQVFSPSYTVDVARIIRQLAQTNCYGTYHVTNGGSCSWYEFTREIFRNAELKTPVIAITSAEYPQKAVRPGYSVLGNYHLQLMGMPLCRPWQDALAEYITARELN